MFAGGAEGAGGRRIRAMGMAGVTTRDIPIGRLAPPPAAPAPPALLCRQPRATTRVAVRRLCHVARSVETRISGPTDPYDAVEGKDFERISELLVSFTRLTAIPGSGNRRRSVMYQTVIPAQPNETAIEIWVRKGVVRRRTHRIIA